MLGERDEEGGQVAFEVEPFLVIECGAGEGPARGFMGLVHEPEEVVAIVGDACRLQLVWLIRERAAADFLVPDELCVDLVGLGCQVQGDVGAVRLIETKEVRELPGPVRLDNPLVVAGETVPEILFRLVPAEGGGRSFAGGGEKALSRARSVIRAPVPGQVFQHRVKQHAVASARFLLLVGAVRGWVLTTLRLTEYDDNESFRRSRFR
nr:hypothetical protein [Streptomyces hygroscopicus]